MKKRNSYHKQEDPNIGIFYETYFEKCFFIALAILKNTEDAKDIVSQAFLNWLEKGEPFSDLNVGRFIVTVRNLCLDFLRRKKKLTEILVENF